MRKFLIFACMTVLMGPFIAGMAHSESLEELRARVRSEVREEMGIKEPVKTEPREEGKKDFIKSKQDIIIQSVLILIVLAMIPATIAKVKGRSFIAWWVLGMLFFIVVFPVSVYMKKLPQKNAQP